MRWAEGHLLGPTLSRGREVRPPSAAGCRPGMSRYRTTGRRESTRGPTGSISLEDPEVKLACGADQRSHPSLHERRHRGRHMRQDEGFNEAEAHDQHHPETEQLSLI